MKINVQASLFPPSNHQFVGGSNYPIFTKQIMIDFELSPARLIALLRGFMELDGIERLIRLYDQNLNTIHLVSTLPQATQADFTRLQSMGWVLDTEKAALYKLPDDRPETIVGTLPPPQATTSIPVSGRLVWDDKDQ